MYALQATQYNWNEDFCGYTVAVHTTGSFWKAIKFVLPLSTKKWPLLVTSTIINRNSNQYWLLIRLPVRNRMHQFLSTKTIGFVQCLTSGLVKRGGRASHIRNSCGGGWGRGDFSKNFRDAYLRRNPDRFKQECASLAVSTRRRTLVASHMRLGCLTSHVSWLVNSYDCQSGMN